MKKLFVIILLLVFIITGCSSEADYLGIPKGYIDKEEYYQEDGFQDYTDYAKYIYDTKDIIVNNKDYKKITKEDIASIKDYFKHHRKWMGAEYDFDESIINEGDYIRIKIRLEKTINGHIEIVTGDKLEDLQSRQYDNYSIYFFDIETLTLYYIHNNI